MTAPQRITVIVDDEHLAGIDAVAERLRAAGMAVEEVLGPIGVITGTAPPGWQAFGDLDGVSAVEQGRTMRIPPSDGPR